MSAVTTCKLTGPAARRARRRRRRRSVKKYTGQGGQPVQSGDISSSNFTADEGSVPDPATDAFEFSATSTPFAPLMALSPTTPVCISPATVCPPIQGPTLSTEPLSRAFTNETPHPPHADYEQGLSDSPKTSVLRDGAAPKIPGRRRRRARRRRPLRKTSWSTLSSPTDMESSSHENHPHGDHMVQTPTSAPSNNGYGSRVLGRANSPPDLGFSSEPFIKSMLADFPYSYQPTPSASHPWLAHPERQIIQVPDYRRTVSRYFQRFLEPGARMGSDHSAREERLYRRGTFGSAYESSKVCLKDQESLEKAQHARTIRLHGRSMSSVSSSSSSISSESGIKVPGSTAVAPTSSEADGLLLGDSDESVAMPCVGRGATKVSTYSSEGSENNEGKTTAGRNQLHVHRMNEVGVPDLQEQLRSAQTKEQSETQKVDEGYISDDSIGDGGNVGLETSPSTDGGGEKGSLGFVWV